MSETLDKLKKAIPRASLFMLLFIEGSIIFASCLQQNGNQQFSLLAQSFLHGMTYFSPIPAHTYDMVFHGGQAYWPLGPGPILLLMPFVALFNVWHLFFYQAYLQIILALLVCVVIAKLARKFGYRPIDALILTAGFTLGSPFIGAMVTSGSYYFAHVLVCLLLLAAMLEYFGKKRPWVLGLFTAVLLITRVSSAAIGLFFVLELLTQHTNKEIALREVGKFLAVASLGVAFLLAYNYSRFGNPFEQGYSTQAIGSEYISARASGLFSPVHIPGNLYYAFLASPAPVFRDSSSHVLAFPYITFSPWGLSIFITSPYLMYLAVMKRKDFTVQVRNLLFAIALSAIMVFSYYGIGKEQFGYRYGLDFLPLVFVLFMLIYRKYHQKLSFSMKSLLILSGSFNIFLLVTFKP